MNIREMLVWCGKGCIAVFLVAIIVMMLLLTSETRDEVLILPEVRAALAEGNIAQADKLLLFLASRTLTEMRVRLGYEDPAVLILMGTVKGELGAYAEALHYFERVLDRCSNASRIFRVSACNSLTSEAHFRIANALFLNLKSGAFDIAVRHLKEGMTISPDDIFAKKTLEWILAFEEEMEKGERGKREIGRGPSLFDSKRSTSPQNMRKGY